MPKTEEEQEFQVPIHWEKIPTGEVDQRILAAREKFEDTLKDHEDTHPTDLVSDDALDRWYAPKEHKTREDAIKEEFGEPVSIWL